MNARRPSLADVARRAAVSTQTVSRVANGRTNVDAATRERVQQAMAELGYRPNRAARALKAGRFHAIGVITSYLTSFGMMRTLDEIVQAASAAGYSITLLPITATSGGVSGAIDRLSEQAVDGIIVTVEPHLLEGAEVTLPGDVPIVVVNTGAGTGLNLVDSDQEGGARLATRHLLDLGHAAVWHLAGPGESASAAHRTRGWAATLREAGLEPPPVLTGDWTAESGYRHGRGLAGRRDVTAVFAANDQLALGLIQALHEAGRAVPDEVSVVGFDDTPESPYFWPPLTTVRQDFTEIGRTAIALLLQQLEAPDPAPGRERLIPTSLVVRQSTAAPPRSVFHVT
ncbi:LacI family DNA-binding transcriptional regulator [Microlunatus parietis]|uniref:DNA-binding LacI/PurR family transcriptional regulator n=1 Tax=Microlunatus parietis TaxID=682979 RepID=A0A7Y9I546_9ACTN|nr:LacI family DNA-binding transcriptional regulator [Microlunatus parietis]NYE70462.1 DNA-binding LacI/PurR family transcriptional regulator [Microlunatus parietis]